MEMLQHVLIEEDEIYTEHKDSNSESSISSNNIQIYNDEEKQNNLPTTSAQNDITLNVCSGFTIYEVEIIKRCDNNYLRDALILNRKKKNALLKILNRLKNHKQNLQNQKVKCKNISVADSDWHKRLSTFRLGMPYFKDCQMYSSPHNEDYYKMQSNNELTQQSYCVPRPWSPVDKCKLALAVYKTICYEKENELKKQIEIIRNNDNRNKDETLEILLKELDFLKNKELIYNIATRWNTAKILNCDEVIERKNELRENISYLQSQILATFNPSYKKDLLEKVKNLEQEFNDIDFKKYIVNLVAAWVKNLDWLYISCNEVQRHTDLECRFMWNSYMKPSNSKKPWTEEQNDELIKAVKLYKMQDWQRISEKVALNKSAYQCCIHFFSKLWDKYRRTKWSKEEELYLKNLISMFQVGDFIPWGKISKYFTERSRQQIYKHYISCMMPKNIKKGAFTLAEDILLCGLLKHYNSFTKTSYYFPNRTIIQLRDRYSSMDFNFRDWTFEDDVSILKHVEKHGEVNWKIASIDRSAGSIRHRYQVLKKWIVEHPGENIQNVIRRKKCKMAQAKYFENKSILDSIVTQLLEDISNGEKAENTFNMDNIQHLLTQIGYTQKEKVKIRKTGRKPAKEENLNYFMAEFLKYYYNFKGRQKSWADYDCARGAERIDVILNLLGAKLHIPEISLLQDNVLLDELDIKILTELSSRHKDNIEPSPSTSKMPTLETVNTEECTTCLPPDPVTLIGFRGVMLHAPKLKNNASNYYHSINRYLPADSRYNISQTGINNTAEIMLNQMESLDKDEQEEVMNNRVKLEKRFKALFKWPAIMSVPSNAPPEDVFSNPVINKPVEMQPAKKVGRPLKVSAKVQRMLEGKKRKKTAVEQRHSAEKKQKVNDE